MKPRMSSRTTAFLDHEKSSETAFPSKEREEVMRHMVDIWICVLGAIAILVIGLTSSQTRATVRVPIKTRRS